MIKYSYLMNIIVFFLLPTSLVAVEVDTNKEDSNQIEQHLLEHLDMDSIAFFWNELHKEYGMFMPEITNKNLREYVHDDQSLSFVSSLKGIAYYLFYEIIENGKLLGTLIILTLVSSILQSMYTTFENSVVSKVAHFVIYIVLITVVLNSFYLVFTYSKETIDMMGSFLIALLPLILSLIATFGQVITVSFFHPIIIFLIHSSGMVVTLFIFPLLYLSALLMIISEFNERFKVTQFAELLRTVSLSALGLFLTIFIGVMSVQGVTTAIQDGVALKTTKFLTGNLIPVVGRTFTEAADTVLSASLLLKNAVGIVGLTIIVLIAIFPAMKILAIAFTYKLSAALLQPIGNKQIIDSLNIVSQYIMYILACLLMVTFMFFLAIVLLTVASNLPLLIK